MTIFGPKTKTAQKLPNFRIPTCFDLENVILAIFSLVCASFSRKRCAVKRCQHRLFSFVQNFSKRKRSSFLFCGAKNGINLTYVVVTQT